jgi:hypothetical protein
MAWMAVAAAAAPIVGGIVGHVLGSKDRKAARAAMGAAMAELQAVGMPPDQSKRLILEEFESQGVYSPELLEDIEMATSQVSILQEDPAMKEAQLKALSSMQQISESGFDAATEADIRSSRSGIEEAIQGNMGQIEQQMAARGQGGGGQELAMKLQAAQEGERRAAEESDRFAAMASQNALQAIAQSGKMAGDMRAQDWDADLTRAGAADKFSLADWGAANARQETNVGAKNAAQERNLGRAEDVADANTENQNQETRDQLNRERQFWLDKQRRAESLSAAHLGQATQYRADAAGKAKLGSDIGSGAGSMLGGMSGGGSAAKSSSIPTKTNQIKGRTNASSGI